jgi:orotate phosphoribosyltransferase
MENAELARVLMQRSYLQREPPQEPFILASGKASRHYFDCERTTSFAPVLPLLAEAFYRLLEQSVVGVGGPTRGADPIADAIAFYSVVKDAHRPINTFSVRRTRKEHGTTGWIEGSAQTGDKIAFVDDVVTSGSSVIDALEKCRDEGLEVIQVLVLVDREEGGLQRIQEYVGPGVPVLALFRYSTLLDYHRSLHDRGFAAVEH